MRILSRRIQKGEGFLKLIPQDEDDFWHLYNLINVGDVIRTSAQRKIVREGQTGSKTSEKRRITILLKVCEVNYWAEQHLLLSVKGRNCRESQWLSLGQFHTVEFEFNYPLVIYKSNWDSFHFRILDEIKAAQTTSDVAALVMEEGVAHLCLIASSTTTLKQKIEKHVVKKRSTNDQRDKSLIEFYHLCLTALEQDQVSCQYMQLFENVKCLIVASPGFIKDDFLTYLKQQVQKEQYKHLQKCISKVLVTPSSNGYMNSLMEVLQDPAVQNRLENTKALQEVKVLERFFNMLRVDIDKVAYGKKDIAHAFELGAIQTLMISDNIARAKDPKTRKEWIKLTDEVKRKGGEVFVFSSLHPSGKQLNGFTGIAAILYFPVQFEYEDDEEEIIPQLVQQHSFNQEDVQLQDSLLQDFDQFDLDDDSAFM